MTFLEISPNLGISYLINFNLSSRYYEFNGHVGRIILVMEVSNNAHEKSAT